jgi:hypothetical protein
MQFDIDEWQRLAREDPGEFERRRRAEIEALISQAPPEQRERLRGLQFRIDLERRRAKTALAAALRLQSMMWERFGQLREALLALTADTPSNRVGQTGAQILPFRKPD